MDDRLDKVLWCAAHIAKVQAWRAANPAIGAGFLRGLGFPVVEDEFPAEDDEYVGVDKFPRSVDEFPESVVEFPKSVDEIPRTED